MKTLLSSKISLTVFRTFLFFCVVFFSGGLAFGQKAVVINEVMYKPADGKVDNEFVELYNPGARDADISGWSLSPLIEHTFPHGTVIPAGGYAVVCRKKEQFLKKGASGPVFGNYSGSLAGGPRNYSGGLVVLKDSRGIIVDHAGWSFRNFEPFGPNWSILKSYGGGASLELVNPAADKALFTSWAASTTKGGTPGERNTTFTSEFTAAVAGSPWLTWSDDPSTTITINWRTAMPFMCRIEYSTGDEPAHEIADDTAATLHHITLKNLAPGAQYRYRIFHGETLVFSSTFKTAPLKDKPFSFSVFGNSRNFPERFKRIVRGINDRRNNFVVSLGDTIESGGIAVEYDPWFFGVGRELFSRIPIMPVIGHHEKFLCREGAGMDKQIAHHIWTNLFKLPLAQKNEAYYSFDYGDAHFVVLDWSLMDKPLSSQTLWLQEDLAATSKKWKIILFHAPMYSPNTAYYDYQVGYRLTCEPIFKEYGVDVVFCAHMHYYEHLFINGIHHIITGGAGSPPSPQPEKRPPYSLFLSGWKGHEDETHYVSATVSKQSIVIKAINDKNEIFDNFTIRKKQP